MLRHIYYRCDIHLSGWTDIHSNKITYTQGKVIENKEYTCGFCISLVINELQLQIQMLIDTKVY